MKRKIYEDLLKWADLHGEPYQEYDYDEEDEEYYCSVNMDEDDMARFVQSDYKECPFFRNGDEYKVVRHQM